MVKFDPQNHHRRSIRLKGFNYSKAGAYFVTIVAFQRECLFGKITEEEMKLNQFGEIIQKCWDNIPIHFPHIETGSFVIMPNHVHGIIVITERRDEVLSPRDSRETGGKTPQKGGETPPLPRPTLGQIVAYFKYQSTKEMNALDGSDAITKFWQRNYYERIIRNEKEMDNIWKYIEANPSMWAEDEENPHRVRECLEYSHR